MDVRMPDGTIISNVPEGTTKAQLLAKYQSYAKSQQTELEPPVEKAGLLRRAGDVGLSAVQGAISLPQAFVGLADIPTGGRVGKALEEYAGYKPEEAKQLLQGMKSPQQQAIDAYVGEEDIGLIEAGKRAIQNPSSIVNMAAQSVPSMLGGAGIARGILGVAPRVGALGAGIAGEGAISAGATAESIRNQTESGYLSPTQSGVAALSGVLTAGFGALGAKASKFLGVEDIDTLLARGVSEADKGSVLVGAFKGALAESAFEELPQSAQEQAAQNIALGRPWDEGVAEAAALGAISALPFGGVAGGIGRSQANTAVEQQLEADKRKAFEADMQARRQATGVMDQQSLFTPEEAPIPDMPVEETPEEAIPEPTLTIPEPEVAPDQMALFGPRGGVTPEAKASVALARQQGIPAEIDTLLQTPEGRKQLAGDMKTYFPELTAQERNKTRKEIQQGVFRTPTAPAAEGELTPALLKQFDITPQRFKGFYTALAGANLADPMTYQMLVQAAESGNVRGMRAAKLLEAFPQYNPEAAQRDLFGGPTSEPRTEPEQPDLFGVPQNGVQADVEPAGVERGVEQPILRSTPEPTAVAEPLGGGLGYAGEPTSGGDVSPEAGQEAEPSALTPKELRTQERAAKAALKKEPVATAWSYMSDIPFGQLPKEAKQQVREAHADGFLTQDVADTIETVTRGNAQKAKTSIAAVDDTADNELMQSSLNTIDAGIQQVLGTKKNIREEDAVSLGDIIKAVSDIMYVLVKRGAQSFTQAMREAKAMLGANAENVTTAQYKQAYDDAVKRTRTGVSKVSTGTDPNAQAEARQLLKGMSGTLIQTPNTPTPTAKEIVAKTVTMAVKDPKGLLAVTEDMITRFRAVVADKNASVAAKIMAYRDGAFYDVNGNVREDMALSAEANTGNFIDQFIKDGDIFIDKNGSVQVRASSYSVDNIFSAAKSLSDRIGVQEAKDLITASFYHYRAAAIKVMPKDQWPDNWKRDPRMVPTDAQINAAMDAFNKVPELEYMRKQFIGAKNNVVKFLNQAGFLGDEKTKEFLADDSYAPWMRIKEYQENAPSMGNIGRMVDLGQMKKLVGGTDEVNDMLENMTQMLAWGVRSGIKNHAANGALNVLATMGAAQKHKARPNGVDPSHVVMTYEGGKPSFWSVDSPSDLGAFLAVKVSDNPYMKAIAKAMGTLRAAIVLFPVFPVAQVIMDSQRAYMQSGVEKPIAMVGKVFKAFLSGEAFRAVSEDALTLRRYGVAAQVDYNTHDASRGLAKQYGVSTDKKSITDRFYETSGYQFLHRLAYSADLAVRLGIYQQVVEESGDKTLAANKAREIINFQKSGTSTKIIVAKQLIPFLGAYLQGMDVNYRSMVGQGNSMKNRKAAAAAYWTNLAMYSALVVAYTMANSGDDDYEEQKGYVTDRNFLIPGGFLIPVPPDVGFLAKVIPERITDYIMQEGTDNPESAERLSRGIAEAAAAAYLPPTAVYGLQPFLELKFNKSFFSNMPIVGEYYSKLEPKYQIAPTTSGTAIAVGNAINASPIQIDYLFNAIGATTAGSILQLADAVMGTTAIAKDKPALVGRFVQKPIGGRETEEFYAVRDLVDRAYTTYNALGEADKIDELELYISDPRIAARLDLRDTIESIGTALSDLRDERNAIYADKALSDTERRVLIDELNTIQEQMLRDAGIRKMRSEIE